MIMALSANDHGPNRECAIDCFLKTTLD